MSSPTNSKQKYAKFLQWATNLALGVLALVVNEEYLGVSDKPRGSEKLQEVELSETDCT